MFVHAGSAFAARRTPSQNRRRKAPVTLLEWAMRLDNPRHLTIDGLNARLNSVATGVRGKAAAQPIQTPEA